MTHKQYSFRAAFCIFVLSSTAVALHAQTSSSSSDPQPELALCSSISLQSVPQLTFKQRACFYRNDLLSPTLALQAGFTAAFGQFANSPHVPKQHFQEFPHRFAVHYATRASRDAGELLVGYLHHEDPRLHPSNAHGFWRRTDAAFLSVMTSPDEDGRLRPAFAPIAGSMSAAVVSSAMYRRKESSVDILSHAGWIYSRYFMRAVFAEFKPEVNSYARHILRRDHN